MDSRVSGLSLGRSRVTWVVLLVDAAAWIIHRPFKHGQLGYCRCSTLALKVTARIPERLHMSFQLLFLSLSMPSIYRFRLSLQQKAFLYSHTGLSIVPNLPQIRRVNMTVTPIRPPTPTVHHIITMVTTVTFQIASFIYGTATRQPMDRTVQGKCFQFFGAII